MTAHLVDRLPAALAPEQLGQRQRDTVLLSWEKRRWTRGRLFSAAGRELLIALPSGTVLKPGTLLALTEDWYVEVEGAPEELWALEPRDGRAALMLAYEIGNHHLPLALAQDRLLVPCSAAPAHTLERLARNLAASLGKVTAVFDPWSAGLGASHG